MSANSKGDARRASEKILGSLNERAEQGGDVYAAMEQADKRDASR